MNRRAVILISAISATVLLSGLAGCATTKSARQASAEECIVRDGRVVDGMGRPMPACVARYDGVMMTTLDGGKLAPMKKNMVMSNGVRCLVDGICIMKDGFKRMLREGELMTPEGKVLTIRRAPDKNPRMNRR